MNEHAKNPVLREIDPILMAVLANRLNAIVREMSNTLLKTARSTVWPSASAIWLTALRAAGSSSVMRPPRKWLGSK